MVSATQITCTFDLTNKINGTYNVVVTNNDGQAGMLVNGFTVTANSPVPTVIGINPTTGVNTSTTLVTVTGTNFNPVGTTTVNLTRTGYNNITMTGVSVSTSTSLSGTVPAGVVAGIWNVVVVNPDGQEGIGSNMFTVTGINPAPTVTGITPASAVNTSAVTVSITGTNFNTTTSGGTTVRLTRAGCSNISVTGLTPSSSTTITGVLLPITAAENGTWNVVVVNPDGQEGTGNNLFTITGDDPIPTPVPIHPRGPVASNPAPISPVAAATAGPGTSSTISVNVGGTTPITGVTVTGTGINNLIVTSTEVFGPGTGVSSPPGRVNEYMDSTPVRYATITGAQISFVVPQSWLDTNHFTPQDIVLEHNVGTGWQALTTTFVKSENGVVYFTATTPGFSRFAITGQVNPSVRSQNPTPSPTVLTMGNLTNSSTTVPPTFAIPSYKQTLMPIAAVPVATTTPTAGLDMLPVLGALVIWGVIFLFRKNRI